MTAPVVIEADEFEALDPVAQVEAILAETAPQEIVRDYRRRVGREFAENPVLHAAARERKARADLLDAIREADERVERASGGRGRKAFPLDNGASIGPSGTTRRSRGLAGPSSSTGPSSGPSSSFSTQPLYFSASLGPTPRRTAFMEVTVPIDHVAPCDGPPDGCGCEIPPGERVWVRPPWGSGERWSVRCLDCAARRGIGRSRGPQAKLPVEREHRRILGYLSSHPDATRAEIEAKAGLDRPTRTVQTRLRELEAGGLIEKVESRRSGKRGGRVWRYYLVGERPA